MTTKTKKQAAPKEDRRDEEQAKAQLESIVKMVEALEDANEKDDQQAQDEARETIESDPLSVQVRSGWYSPGETPEAEEFSILLCTGGPAVRIIGELDEHNEPYKARLEYQDWGTPWTFYFIEKESDKEALLTYCRQFYFGGCAMRKGRPKP